MASTSGTKQRTKGRPVRPDDLADLGFVMQATLSPDGKRAVYEVAHLDAATDTDRITLWLLDVDSGESRPLTSGDALDMRATWSPDSREIAFLSTRAGAPQVFVLAVDGGEARQVTSQTMGVMSSAAWSPDGSTLAFNAPSAPPRDPTKPYRWTRALPRIDEVPNVDDILQDVFVVPAAGGEVTQLTHDATMNMGPTWSPDGTELLYMASHDPDDLMPLPRPRLVDLDGNVRDVVKDADDGLAVGAACWAGDRIVLLAKPRTAPIAWGPGVWVVDRQGGEPELRSKLLPDKLCVAGMLQSDMPPIATHPWPRIMASPNGKHALVNVQDGGTTGIYEFSLSGRQSCRPLVVGDRAAYLYGATDSRLLYVVTDWFEPGAVYASARNGSDERKLTDLNADVIGQWTLPKIEHLDITATDGAPVEGWFLRPPKGKAPYPTVLVIHGGPHAGFGHVFHFDMLMLTGAGFGVLVVNQRGSTGYGDDFAQDMEEGRWGVLDYEDLMAGVDVAVAKRLADPDRLGINGASGGGNLSMWAVTQTDRFKAAVPECGVSNWLEMYALSDGGSHWWRAMGKQPNEDPEVWARCSPLTFAHRCTTPTLLIHGENDFRATIQQSESFYTYLKANGCPVEMIRIPGGSHMTTLTIGNPAARRAQNEGLLEWMTRYVLGEASS